MYDCIVNKFPDKITDNIELEQIMKHLKPKRYTFKGVYSRDTIPRNLPKESSIIFNNLDSDTAGEHWLAMINSGKHKYIYDSFGRPNNFFKFNGGQYIQSDNKPEQEKYEYDCGYRCIAWIMTCDKFGVEHVSSII